MNNSTKNISLLLFLAATLSILSCSDMTFNPKDEYFVNVPQPEINENNIVINLNSVSGNSDTLTANGYVTLTYSMNIDNKPVREVVFYLDSALIKDSYDGKVNFQSTDFPDGLHNLKLVITTGTGSGSLADRYWAESFVVTKTFPLYIENTPPPALKITSAYEENGKLKLTWEKCTSRTFQFYEVIEGTLRDTVRNANQNSIYADNFVGGLTNFQVNVTTSAGRTDGITYMAQDTAPQINNITALDNFMVKIEWDSSKYFSNVGYYSIGRRFNNQSNSYQELAQIQKNQARSFIDGPVPFGTEVEYEVDTYPAIGYSSARSGSKPFYIGNQRQFAGYVGYLKSNNSFYVNNNGIISRLDGDNMNKIATSSLSIGSYDISADGTEGFAVKSDHHNSTEIWEFDPATMQKGKSYFTEDFVGYKSIPERIFYIVPDKIIYQSYIEKQENQFYSDKLIMINISNGDTASLGDNSYNYPTVIGRSSNGKYIAASVGNNLNIYSVSQNKFILTFSSPTDTYGMSGFTFCFDQNGDNFISTGNNAITIRSCAGGIIIKQFPVGDQLVNPVVDPSTGYLGAFVNQRNLFRIYDLSSGKVKKEIPVSGDQFSFENSILFSSNYYLRIKY